MGEFLSSQSLQPQETPEELELRLGVSEERLAELRAEGKAPPAPRGYSSETHGKIVGGKPAAAYQTSANVPVETGSDMITTARDTAGNRVSLYDLKDDTIVTIAGCEMSYASAKKAGLVKPSSFNSGQPANAAAADQDGGNEEDPNPFEDPTHQAGEEAFTGEDNAIERHVNDIATKMEGGVQQALIEEVSRTGELSTNSEALVAEAVGGPENVEKVRGAFERQALGSIAKATSLDADEVVAWAYENAPGEMAAAIRRHITERSTKGYLDVIAKYVDAALEFDGLPQTAGGIIATQERGKIVLGIPGHGRMSLGEAVRQGLVKLGRAA